MKGYRPLPSQGCCARWQPCCAVAFCRLLRIFEGLRLRLRLLRAPILSRARSRPAWSRCRSYHNYPMSSSVRRPSSSSLPPWPPMKLLSRQPLLPYSSLRCHQCKHRLTSAALARGSDRRWLLLGTVHLAQVMRARGPHLCHIAPRARPHRQVSRVDWNRQRRLISVITLCLQGSLGHDAPEFNSQLEFLALFYLHGDGLQLAHAVARATVLLSSWQCPPLVHSVLVSACFFFLRVTSAIFACFPRSIFFIGTSANSAILACVLRYACYVYLNADSAIGAHTHSERKFGCLRAGVACKVYSCNLQFFFRHMRR